MTSRRGERIGWLGGIIGGSVWLVVPPVAYFLAGRPVLGLLALTFYPALIALAVTLAPWKHPQTPFWKLFLPPVALNLVVAVLCIATLDDPRSPLRSYATIVQTAVLLGIPLAVAGRRRWADGEPRGGPEPAGRGSDAAPAGTDPTPA